ncbi:MAG: NUDIX domain-containing protein [Saccharofermentanales bacterium]
MSRNFDFREKVIDSQNKFSGNIFEVRVDQVELPDGNKSFREIVKHHGGASIVALTDDQSIFLVEQYRISVGQTVLEIPAGKIEEGEEHLFCAQRELKEEIGATATNWELLTDFYPTPGYCSEVIHIFLARDLVLGQPELDQGEFLRVKKIKLEQALKMVYQNKIKDSKTIIGLLLTAQRLLEELNG